VFLFKKKVKRIIFKYWKKNVIIILLKT